MKKEKILNLFKDYTDKNRLAEFIYKDSQLAIIFVFDEIEIDMIQSKIKLPELGWFTVGEKTIDDSFDWVSVYEKEDQLVMLIDNGNPFENKELPIKNGVICAVPFSI